MCKTRPLFPSVGNKNKERTKRQAIISQRRDPPRGKNVEAEVYFGWSIPHEAAPGGFIDPGGA